MIKRTLCAVILSMLVTRSLAPDKKDELRPAQSIGELQQQLEQILKETHTPGMSVAIVRKDGPEWVGGVGLADVAAGRPDEADTVLHIGSISKSFVSLSILKLAREGKLSLDDPVAKLAPDVAFENRWERTNPVRVVHLLEHTTGWDDMHLKEYLKDAPGIDLRTALEFGRASRVSRWPPGTRMCYSNTGPTVAAYIVEKVTGQRFEDYVRQNFFTPIGMNTATYFEPPADTTAKLYHVDGKTPYRYWNFIYRPAGSMSASANDMARYVMFYLNRGTVNGVQVTPPADIDRMESPATTWAAKDGLKSGYGLGNYWSIEDGFVYHGHNGGVIGGLTSQLEYMPEYGVGFFFSINSGNNWTAFVKVSKAIRNYITRRLPKPVVPAPAPLPSDAAEYAGWYEPSAVRPELIHFLVRLQMLSRVQFRDGKMTIRVRNNTQTFVPVAGKFFRYVPKHGPPDPVATAVLLSNKQFIYAETTLIRVPGWLACSEIVLIDFFLLALVSISVYAPFWLFGGLMGHPRRPAERAMRVYPLIAVLSLVLFEATYMLGSTDGILSFGNLTLTSAMIFFSTVVFAIATIMGVWSVAAAQPQVVRRPVRWFSGIVSVALMIALTYFAYWGIIGVRTWV